MKRVIGSGGKPCPTGKHRYRDHVSAERMVRVFQETERKRQVSPKRSYWCPLCKGWHLTSQAIR